MLSKQQIKKYSSLRLKKFRQAYGLFLVEGIKSIEELLQSEYDVEHLFCNAQICDDYPYLKNYQAEVISDKLLERMSNMKTATSAIAVVRIPQKEPNPEIVGRSVLIEDIQDPGNLGTIIRTAHWFGFNQVVCSNNSVDCYNPKVIQASMGAVFQMPVVYVDLCAYIQQMQSKNLRVIGAFLEGSSMYQFDFNQKDSFLLGNEGQGISDTLRNRIEYSVNIPHFSDGRPPESLNIASACSVFCSEMSRYKKVDNS